MRFASSVVNAYDTRREDTVSRIGKKPIDIPDGVRVQVDGNQVHVSGPKGEVTVPMHPGAEVKVENHQVCVISTSDRTAIQGLIRALVANAIQGVVEGFLKRLHLVGIGYRSEMEGKDLKLSLGLSHPIVVFPPEDIEFSVEAFPPAQLNLIGVDEGTTGSSMNVVTVSGIDKQQVGEVAAGIRALRPPEPYLGKGIRYDGEYVRRKPGKQAV